MTKMESKKIPHRRNSSDIQ